MSIWIFVMKTGLGCGCKQWRRYKDGMRGIYPLRDEKIGITHERTRTPNGFFTQVNIHHPLDKDITSLTKMYLFHLLEILHIYLIVVKFCT